jgi:hypothetical protein
MSRSRFAGFFNALDFSFGVTSYPAALKVSPNPNVQSTLTLDFGYFVLFDGTPCYPLNTNAPIRVGLGSNEESVTPSGVSGGGNPGYQTNTVTASFSNAHGGDQITSGTVGLQEAINFAAGKGGGVVVVDGQWALNGGTTAMLTAAVLPANGSVIIQDNRGGGVQYFGNRPDSATVIAAPATPTSATAFVLSAAGTYTNGNVGVTVTGVTADGGETTLSSSYTLATGAANTAIGGTGIAVTAGLVGYRVYLTTVGGSTPYLLPVTAANSVSGAAGLVTAGPLTAFAIGSSWQSLAPLTSANGLQPTVNTAFSSVGTTGIASSLNSSWPSFGNVGAISAGAATSMGVVQLSTGFLNVFGRTIRVKGCVAITVNSATGLITLNLNYYSLFGTTKITPFTTATPSAATGGTQVINLLFEAILTTSKTGTTGTFEAHGFMVFNAAGTLVSTVAQDDIDAASSTVDLTTQGALEVSITTTTIAPTAGTLRQLTIEVLA